MSQVYKVLVIEDEETIRNILRSFLERFFKDKGLECEVKTMEDPVQGLFELSTNGGQYNVILLDVLLPKLTGDEIYNSLTHANPELVDRVMFVTGYSGALLERFPEASLKILQKPFRYEDFCGRIDEILNQA